MKISKKHLIFISSFISVFIIVGGFLFLILPKKTTGPATSPILVKSIPSSTVLEEAKSYKDETNGISFSYPGSFSVESYTDKESVAAWILTSQDMKGRITIKIQEPKDAYTLKEWLPTYKEASRAASVIGITVADEKASQYVFADPSIRNTAMFHQGVLYLFEGTSDKGGTFDKAYEMVLSSFAFLPETAAGGGGGNVEYEEEEVVE